MIERIHCAICRIELNARDIGHGMAQAHDICLSTLLNGTLKEKLEILNMNSINKTRIFYNKQQIFTQSFNLKVEANELPMMHVEIPVIKMDVEKQGEYTVIRIVDEYTDDEVR